MPSIRVTELKKGMVINFDGDLFVVTKYEHLTPGNLRAIHHVSLKSLRTGNQKQMRLGTSDMLDVAYLDKKICQFLYKDTTGYVFMDTTTYEQHTLSPELVEEAMKFIKENDEVQVTFHEVVAVGVEVPSTVTLVVTEAEEAVKGNSVTNLQKIAKLETGIEVKVPLHIKVGERVKISTTTSEFLGRAND